VRVWCEQYGYIRFIWGCWWIGSQQPILVLQQILSCPFRLVRDTVMYTRCSCRDVPSPVQLLRSPAVWIDDSGDATIWKIHCLTTLPQVCHGMQPVAVPTAANISQVRGTRGKWLLCGAQTRACPLACKHCALGALLYPLHPCFVASLLPSLSLLPCLPGLLAVSLLC